MATFSITDDNNITVWENAEQAAKAGDLTKPGSRMLKKLGDGHRSPFYAAWLGFGVRETAARTFGILPVK